MGDMQRRAPRAVPIVVSAGLAVGVFCGLLFGLGTGVTSAATELPPKALPNPPTEVATAPEPRPPPPPPPEPPPPSTIKVTVDITPRSAASNAKISIDGKALDGTSIEVPIESKSVRLSIAAEGFRSIDKSIELEGADTTIKQEMSKRRSVSTRPAKDRSAAIPDDPPTPTRKPRGIIDL